MVNAKITKTKGDLTRIFDRFPTIEKVSAKQIIDIYQRESKRKVDNSKMGEKFHREAVKKDRKEGHCPDLKSMFEMTRPTSWQLHEHAVGGMTFAPTFDQSGGVNARIPQLELIKDRPLPYSYSVLGKLESFLDNMDTYPL